MRHDDRWSRLATTVAVAMLAPALALAVPQQQVNDQRAASPDVRIDIDEIVVGSIVVTGWEQNRFELTGTVGADVEDFQVEGSPDHIEVRADLHGWNDDSDPHARRNRRRNRNHDDAGIELQIHAPRGASLRIEGVTASITINDVDGTMELESVTGRIQYTGNATRLDLANVTGAMQVQAPEVTRGDFESVNGDISFRGGFGVHAEINFENVNGDIELALQDDVSASFDIETTLGKVVNDIGPEARRSSRWIPSQELRFKTGGGDAEVSVETLQGTIRLRRQ